MAREGDDFEAAWLAYYRSVFNPAGDAQGHEGGDAVEALGDAAGDKQIPEMLAEVPERLECFARAASGRVRASWAAAGCSRAAAPPGGLRL